ncbi:unnamed protein product [Withania somnifera]
MVERRWQAVIWIRCFTRRCFSSSRKNCMGVSLGGTSRMTIPRNSTSTQRFKPDCRKWAIHFCISMRSSTEPTILGSNKPGGFYEEGGTNEARGLVKEGGKGRQRSGCLWGGVPRRNKGMKGLFALDAL